ncbi:hypothetical protein [Phaffia rhodozyma]|uniref:Uncharacterized protein n=1 Tax=Phaffia rhodozyma TaxID=264483 RepID=A0A0F7SII8_PHARH|nr:hypothetical protein [Phaffia rhodozyma]
MFSERVELCRTAEHARSPKVAPHINPNPCTPPMPPLRLALHVHMFFRGRLTFGYMYLHPIADSHYKYHIAFRLPMYQLTKIIFSFPLEAL